MTRGPGGKLGKGQEGEVARDRRGKRGRGQDGGTREGMVEKGGYKKCRDERGMGHEE